MKETYRLHFHFAYFYSFLLYRQRNFFFRNIEINYENSQNSY